MTINIILIEQNQCVYNRGERLKILFPYQNFVMSNLFNLKKNNLVKLKG